MHRAAFDHTEARRLILALPGVSGVADLRSWRMCSHLVVCTAHVQVDVERLADTAPLLAAIEHVLADAFRVRHVTVHFETAAMAGTTTTGSSTSTRPTTPTATTGMTTTILTTMRSTTIREKPGGPDPDRLRWIAFRSPRCPCSSRMPTWSILPRTGRVQRPCWCVEGRVAAVGQTIMDPAASQAEVVDAGGRS